MLIYIWSAGTFAAPWKRTDFGMSARWSGDHCGKSSEVPVWGGAFQAQSSVVGFDLMDLMVDLLYYCGGGCNYVTAVLHFQVSYMLFFFVFNILIMNCSVIQ